MYTLQLHYLLAQVSSALLLAAVITGTMLLWTKLGGVTQAASDRPHGRRHSDAAVPPADVPPRPEAMMDTRMERPGGLRSQKF